MLWKIGLTASQLKIVYEKVQFLFDRNGDCKCNVYECFFSEEEASTPSKY